MRSGECNGEVVMASPGQWCENDKAAAIITASPVHVANRIDAERMRACLRPGGSVLTLAYGEGGRYWSDYFAATLNWVGDIAVLHPDYAPVGSRFGVVRWWVKPGSHLPDQIRFERSNVVIAGRDDHFSGMSAELARYLIEIWTRPGDLIIDPYCGNGSVPMAAAQLGRCFIARCSTVATRRAVSNRVAHFEVEDMDEVEIWQPRGGGRL